MSKPSDRSQTVAGGVGVLVAVFVAVAVFVDVGEFTGVKVGVAQGPESVKN